MSTCLSHDRDEWQTDADHPGRGLPGVTAPLGGLVVHYRSRFLAPSETFILTVLGGHVRYRAAVVTHERRGEPALPPEVALEIERYPPSRWARFARTWLPTQRIRQGRSGFERAVIRIGPDVVHAHFAEEGITAAPAARRAGIPLVVTFYGHDATDLPRRWGWSRRIRGLFRQAAFVLAEGPHLRERLTHLGCPPERVRIQPIPVRLDLFPFRPPTAARGDATVVQACRFVPKKGVDLTLRAFALAAGTGGARLRLIGDGPERPRLEALSRELEIADRVEFLGMRTHAEYARDLAGADIFMQPSRYAPSGDGEGGAPATLLEAQAIGLPIVATTHADIPFVTRPGAALLAAEEDVRGLAAHLRHLLDHPAEWGPRGRAGREHVEQQHDAGILIDRLESIYDEARAWSAAGGRE